MTAKQLPVFPVGKAALLFTLFLIGLAAGLFLPGVDVSVYRLFAMVVLSVSVISLVGTLISGWLTIYLTYLYRKLYRADIRPAQEYAQDALPRVTIQLPIYNEANVIERLLRSAAAIDYPHDQLQIQVIDDSSDETTEIVEAVFHELRNRYPLIDFQHLRRSHRQGWKAGALNYGLDRASGEFLAIFDADFVIPSDFLRRTVHFFTGENVGLVQARWAFMNRQQSALTATQADKLDSHQMYEQSARHWSGRWIFFHGTAGIWRKSAIASAGRWSSVTDIEDADLSIRALLKDWQFIYLNDLQVMSELPSAMGAYLTQQRRWKRGWIKIFQLYWWKILRSQAPFWVRLDMLLRLVNMFLTLASLIVSLGALPAFLFGQTLGLAWLVYGLYTSLLITSVIIRVYEANTLRTLGKKCPSSEGPRTLIEQLKAAIPFRVLLDMGTLWTWTVGTLEAFTGKSKFERTPKLRQVDDGTEKGSAFTKALGVSKSYQSHSRFLELGTLGLGALTVACIYFAIATEHWLSIVFYGLQLAGIAWTSTSLITEQRRYSNRNCWEASVAVTSASDTVDDGAFSDCSKGASDMSALAAASMSSASSSRSSRLAR